MCVLSVRVHVCMCVSENKYVCGLRFVVALCLSWTLAQPLFELLEDSFFLPLTHTQKLQLMHATKIKLYKIKSVLKRLIEFGQ